MRVTRGSTVATSKNSKGSTQSQGFINSAKDLGLDTDEANEAFERAFGKIAPPKKKERVPSKSGDEAPYKDE